MTDELIVFHVWQPEVAQRAYDATMLPHILQVTTQTTEPMRHSLYSYHTMMNFSNSFSTCATTQTIDGYSCAICKQAYNSQGTSSWKES
jgi:hypothetical protein